MVFAGLYRSYWSYWSSGAGVGPSRQPARGPRGVGWQAKQFEAVPSRMTTTGASSASPAPKSGKIRGPHFVGDGACDMDAMALEGGAQQVARIVGPRPTARQAVFDVPRAVDGW